jgi:tRNA (guanine37-N1)-methyltransferase
MRDTLRTELEGILPYQFFTLVPSSFDILGSREKAVAIIEIPNELTNYQIEVAMALTRVHKNVKSVLVRKSAREGKFRIRELHVIYGDRNTEIIHRESGCRFKLDPRNTYFSSRESTERERIVRKVNSGDKVLVMFSGVGPLPICITKKTPSSVTAIELNPFAHHYCLENIKLNKVTGYINAILGDVREICPIIGKDYDRTIMPLPKGAYKYLDVAIPTIKEGGILHFYHWAPESDLWSEAVQHILDSSEKCGREVEILDRVKVSQYSPRYLKVRVDAIIT